MPTGDASAKDSVQRQIADLRKELEALRRQVPDEGYRHPKKDRAIFSHAAVPTLNAVSPPYVYFRPRGYLTRVVLASTSAGTTGTTVVVQRRSGNNYVALATVTLNANDEYTVEDDFMSEVEDLDRIFVVATQVGAGMTDLTVTVTFMESVE